MNQEIMLERVAMLLSRFSEEVKILNFNGEFSINVHAENALIRLLDAVFECKLENVNYVENKQFPSIDLRDSKKKIAIQVTADESLKKVLDCLNKFLKFNLNNDYDELYIVMLVRKQKKYSKNSIDKARKSFKFSQENILEIKDLYAMLSAKNDINTIKTVLEYLEMQFSDHIAYEVWKKYTSDLKEYDKSIIRQFEYVDISGYSPKINNLQVKVSLDELYVHQLLGYNINSQKYSLPISHLLISESKAVVLGNPGAGKSTLLKWFMFDICTHREQYSTEIPVYIKCAIYAKKMMNEQMDLSSYILNALNLKNQSVYRDAILNGYLVVLLDGLDEIGDISLRHDVVDNINLFVAQNPCCRVIVTSRKIGYNETRLDAHFNHYELLPFNENQIVDFIKNWYMAVESDNYDEENVNYLPDSLYFFYPCPGSRVNSGIASIYGRFRYFSQLHNFTFRHFSSHLFAPKSSKSSSKFFRKSGRQPFHFLAGRSISSVCIVVQGHIDAVVPHDILQCFRVHPGTCHFRAERMP